jgi:pyruvate,water dikinase
MSTWRRLFGRGRKRETVASLRSKIERFRTLLDRNNLVLELMAEAGESLGGDLLFDFQYLRRLAAGLDDAVQRVVLDLNLITDNRYPALVEAFEKIRGRVAEVLQARPSVPDTTPYVLRLDEIDRDLSGVVGEKMARLGEIRRRLKYNVPDGFAITARACTKVFEEIQLADRLREVLEERDQETSPARRIEARLGKLIREAPLPREVSRAIRKALAGLAQRTKPGDLFALRSSALGEDGELSFAGLHETCLGVSAAEVLERYKQVLAGLFTAAAIVYRDEHQEPLEQALMAVGCMRMVPAKSSGVVYTLDPNRPERDVLIVSAAPGLGKTVVEGGGSVDQFVISRTPPYPVLSREVSLKDQMYELDLRGGIRLSGVPPERRDLPAVSEEFLAGLAEAALKIERYMTSAQDIEWAEDEDGSLVILQARTLRLRADVADIDRQAQAAMGQHRILLAGRGTIACRGIGYGRAVVVRGDEKPDDLPQDFVLVAHLSSPHLAELVPRANAVITDVGASTGHLATITREFHVPAIVDAGTATTALAGGPEITVDAEENIIYEGRVDELLRYQILRQSSFEDCREFRVLRRLLKQVAPLNLKDPQAKNFTPRHCRTYHDIIRFAHEKGVEYFLEGHEISAAPGGLHSKTVDMAVPLGLAVIDIGGGLQAAKKPSCSLAQIRCIPLKALLEGLNTPGAWSTEPTDMDLGSFISSALGRPVPSAPQDGLPRRNLAVVSDHYLNLNLNLGYHFNQVDSYISEVRNDNYVHFRFVGGLTDIARRSRRAKMISIILERQDFIVDTKGDFIVARLKKFEQPTMLQKMKMLGLLIGFTRQMDVRMRGDSLIAKGVDEFMEFLYNTQNEAGSSQFSS